jgi:signal recognition particle GTPase
VTLQNRPIQSKPISNISFTTTLSHYHCNPQSPPPPTENSSSSIPNPNRFAKMVLAQLGGSISRALQQMSNATIIDEKVLNECLNEITRALLQSDVQFKLVRDMQTNIKKIVNLDDLAAGHNKRRIIQQVGVFFFLICQLFL